VRPYDLAALVGEQERARAAVQAAVRAVVVFVLALGHAPTPCWRWRGGLRFIIRIFGGYVNERPRAGAALETAYGRAAAIAGAGAVGTSFISRIAAS
jgi:hypothetical protein